MEKISKRCTKPSIFFPSSNSSFTAVEEIVVFLGFAKIGLGIGFIAKEFIQKELENEELYVLNVSPSFPKQKLLDLTKKDYLPSFCTKKFIEIINS